VPEVIDADALVFATVRAAHVEPARQVADDLLDAAAQPANRLNGVTPYQARMMAAQVLSNAGDWAGARDVLDGFPDTAGAGLIVRASECLGGGDLAAAQALVSQIRNWPVGDTYGLSMITTLVLKATEAGYFDQALAWTDAAWTAAMDNLAGEGGAVAYGPKILQIMEKEVREQHQRRAAAGGTRAQPVEPQVQPARAARREIALVAESRPWPALVDGRLLWWPYAEYQRLVAQVPDLRNVIGATWPQHRARVESTLRAFRHRHGDNRVVLSLARAEFGAYVQFLERAGADPRQSEPLTAFTGFSAERQKPVRWPPRGLDRCWCGSGRRYSRCCGSAVSG
jgi:hypothetical protein